eukprot:543511-Ditylum_brightwellii.AAC.1
MNSDICDQIVTFKANSSLSEVNFNTHIKCQAVYRSGKKQKYCKGDDIENVKMKDVDTVVMCTGYDSPSISILCNDLQLDSALTWSVLKGWVIENNHNQKCLTKNI